MDKEKEEGEEIVDVVAPKGKRVPLWRQRPHNSKVRVRDRQKEKQKEKEKEMMANLQSLSLEELNGIDLDAIDVKKRARIVELINLIKERKLDYPILDFVPQEKQQQIVEAIGLSNEKGVPVYKYIMFIGGNGSGKTINSVYIDILKALGQTCKKYGLPYIGEAKQILVVTKTSDSIKTNLEPYFLGTDSIDDKLKIPKAEIKSIQRDPSSRALKEIVLKNGCKIMFRTYDAGQARLEGSSPDFIHLDELPEREDIFIELLRGTRKENSQMLMSFTPTKFNAVVYNYFYGQESEAVVERTFIRQIDSLENKYADHTWLLGLTEEEVKIRRFGMFIPPTGLVYNKFMRNKNVVPHMSPKTLGECRFYGALDFGVNHPMAFLFIAVDGDGHIFVFDMIYERKLLLSQLSQRIREKLGEYNITLEYIVADTADARSRLELEQYGIYTIPADKFTKGTTNMSNRRAGILKLNGLFENEMMYISDKCEPLIREFELHAYKGNGSEDVIKENDDAIDALRYFVFSYKPANEVRPLVRRIKKTLANVSAGRERY